MELLGGCGSSRIKRVGTRGTSEWIQVITLDNNPAHRPDVVGDLEFPPYPFKENTFDEIHLYDVLEHLGDQGDWKSLFDQFSDLHRIIKPGGLLAAIVPAHDSLWAWGDPSHRRIINQGTLAFLDQSEYARQVGGTSMSDFRFYYRADWRLQGHAREGDSFIFVLEARKGGPRWTPHEFPR